MASSLVELVREHFPDAVLESHALHGDDTVVVNPAAWKVVARFLRDDPRADMRLLVDLTAVDFPEREPRFDVVAHFCSLSRGIRLRLKTRVGDRSGEHAELDSLTELWASANWAERETYDMFGVVFTGHPDLRRILLYPEFEGHPLRKDYPAGRTQPLIMRRDAPNTDKLPPFGDSEGMSFGRKTYALERSGQPSTDDEVL